MEAYENVLKIIPLAQITKKLSAICYKCHGSASYTMRKIYIAERNVVGLLYFTNH